MNLFNSGIFIFYMEKKKRHVEILIKIQAFELLVFTKLESKRTFQAAGLDPASTTTAGGTRLLGCYLIYL